ncbi:glycoside hydrolase family 16 protein [Wolfiporia cocos MD-104 SS10]|uniref:Glycoside hydrolase family 16 protein n=1 Tax=Wolfiporia cocos (strain MD-104) TaxID=742152 RepID=A0A2H3IUT0_WOLCO|nr:glycoside hydrolase family 16 protein [Wolfiporia cocos MD-104 SS10]
MAYQSGSLQRRFVPPSAPSTTNLLATQSRLSHASSVNIVSASTESGYSQVASTESRHSQVLSYNFKNDSKYLSGTESVSEKFSLSPDPATWNATVSPDVPEDDDALHTPDPRRDCGAEGDLNVFTSRGFMNLGFLAGSPIILYFKEAKAQTDGGYNLGGINASGQVPESFTGNFGLIDKDTPKSAYTKADYVNGNSWQLVFSDEFNVDGRTFWPGDDPYWEAVNLHYWQTENLEWLDPTAITTRNGSLEIVMSEKPKNNLNYTSGMMTTWNKFCFTGGLLEVSASLPGVNNVVGLWPAIWTMGNLGRAGYGASLEGTARIFTLRHAGDWPYTYDACDVGTAPNQTKDGQPVAATVNGDPQNGGVLSYMPGQRLSRCSCPGSSHPGPMHSDGTYVGRSAPEIDVFEAQVSGSPLSGQVSQSGQWAPFNYEYQWFNTTDNYSIRNESATQLNTYMGGVYQQATSAVTETDGSAYQGAGGQYSVYGMQYQPGFDGAYISWISGGELAWTLEQSGMAADSTVQISSRPVSQEPMYIIMNLGISLAFGGYIDFAHLQFPSIMRVDYVRVYQDPSNINIGCDPPDFPTAAYINEYIGAYTNPNYTTWRDDFGQPFPKNSFLEDC